MKYENIIHNLSIIDQDIALKAWFLLDSYNIDCLWNEDKHIHQFIMRKTRVKEPMMHGNNRTRSQVLALLEQDPVPA